MALGGFRPYHFIHRNLPPLNPVENELARDPGPVGGSHSGSISHAPSRNSTPGPKLVLTLIPALILTPAPPSSNELFKQFIKVNLESNQRPKQSPAEHKQSF